MFELRLLLAAVIHRATRSRHSLADMRCTEFVLVVELHLGGGCLEPQIFTGNRHGTELGTLELHMGVTTDFCAPPGCELRAHREAAATAPARRLRNA